RRPLRQRIAIAPDRPADRKDFRTPPQNRFLQPTWPLHLRGRAIESIDPHDFQQGLSMLWALYQQHLDPLAGTVPGSVVWSTILAALPVLVLFWLLVPWRWLAPKAGAAAAVTALVIAVLVYGMPPVMAGMAFCHGAAFGLLPVGWTIFNAMLL